VFELTVGARFVASHQLRGLDGVLEKPHEHVWGVRVAVAGSRLDRMGVLVDFGRVRAELAGLLGKLDNRNLNRVPAFEARNPSAENVATYLAEQLARAVPKPARLAWVEVEEEPGCTARYYPTRGAKRGA
jgi:6-pyruvoyltetrahydropterin/6-carboxytetrahydropterin synthase